MSVGNMDSSDNKCTRRGIPPILRKRKKNGHYQEEEHVAMVRAVLKVHAESGVHVAQMVMVVQLSKSLVGQLRLATEALEDVITWDTVRSKLRENASVKQSGPCQKQNLSHHFYAQGLTLEKVGYPQLILCSCIHLQALAAVKHMIVVMVMVMIMIVVMVMAMTVFLFVAVMTGLTEQKTSQKNQPQFAKYETLSLKGCACSALSCKKIHTTGPMLEPGSGRGRRRAASC